MLTSPAKTTEEVMEMRAYYPACYSRTEIWPKPIFSDIRIKTCWMNTYLDLLGSSLLCAGSGLLELDLEYDFRLRTSTRCLLGDGDLE